MAKVLTPARRARLEKLAAYLEGLPEDYAHFNMDHWFDGASANAMVNYAKHNGGVASCGAVACAVGHGPAAGILVPPRFIRTWDDRASVMWLSYALDLFCNGNERLRVWLFGGQWEEVDNHHYGAAARIRYVLDKGGAPGRDEFDYDPLWRHVKLYAPYRIDSKARADA